MDKQTLIDHAMKMCVGMDRPPDIAGPCGFHRAQAEAVVEAIWPLLRDEWVPVGNMHTPGFSMYGQGMVHSSCRTKYPKAVKVYVRREDYKFLGDKR